MHFSYTDKHQASKASRLVLIAGLHVAVGVLFVHGINARHLSLSSLPAQVLVMIQPAPPPPTPPSEPAPLRATATPDPQPVQATPAPPGSVLRVPATPKHTSGSQALDRAAIRALSLCKFKPATSKGVPEAGWAQLAYVWALD